ncbi:hypothetical protein ACW9H6_28620, partial [Pseudomonas sp. SDO528_S397]
MQTLPLRVLVLNDTCFQRTTIVNMLRQLGCDFVFSATCAHHALSALNCVGPVDIALCDLRKESLDSLNFLKHSAQRELVRSVIISNSLDEDVGRAAGKLIPLMGLRLLGELGSYLQLEKLGALLKNYLTPPPRPPAVHRIPLTATEAQVRQALALVCCSRNKFLSNSSTLQT